METCERRGMFCSGYHASQAALAPKGYLTGAEWNWEGVYTAFVKRFQAGENCRTWHVVACKQAWLNSPYGTAVGEGRGSRPKTCGHS